MRHLNPCDGHLTIGCLLHIIFTFVRRFWLLKGPLNFQRALFIFKSGFSTPENIHCGPKSGRNNRIADANKALGKIGNVYTLRLGTGGGGKSEQETIKFGIIQYVQLKKLH